MKEGRNSRSFWSVPETTDYTHACEMGTLYAATWLIYMNHQPDRDAHVLTWALIDMIENGKDQLKDGKKGYIVGFMQLIGSVLRRGMDRVSDQGIASAAAASVARSKGLMASLPA